MPETLRAERIREPGDRARELAKLAQHPAWDVLRKDFEERKRLYLQRLARKLTVGGRDAEPLNQREIDYERGFLRGAAAVLEAPENAVKVLEKLERELEKET